MLRRDTWPELFRLGWPIGVGFGLESGLFTAATLMVGRLPNHEVALAAHQIAINAASVSFMVPLGIGMAGGVRVGQAAGAGPVMHVGSKVEPSALHTSPCPHPASGAEVRTVTFSSPKSPA